MLNMDRQERTRGDGLSARDARFSEAIAEFFRDGGTVERGQELLLAGAVEKMGSEGRVVCADKAKETVLSTSRNDAASGLRRSADKAVIALPDAAIERSTGQLADADKATKNVPVASSRRKPGHAKRGAIAISSVQPAIANSLFDTYRLPGDGRAIGDISWKELQYLARQHAEAYRLLSLIDGYGSPADIDAKVRDVLKEETLSEFVRIARLRNVH